MPSTILPPPKWLIKGLLEVGGGFTSIQQLKWPWVAQALSLSLKLPLLSPKSQRQIETAVMGNL